MKYCGMDLAIATRSASDPLDTAWHRSFSGAATAARALAEQRDTLDPDGCLVRFGSQPTSEKQGAVSTCRIEGG